MVDQQDVEGGVAAAPLSGNSPSKSLVESMGSENQVEESFEEGEVGEIMVEIVGSDVYVDGVSGEKEGNLESAEVGDLEGKIEESHIHIVSEAKKVGESVVGPSESKDEKRFVSRGEVDTTLCKSVDVKCDVVSALPPSGVSVVNDEAWNPGIEGGSSSVATLLNSEAVGASPMVTVEDKINEAEAVTGHKKAVPDENSEIDEKKQVLPSNDNTASGDQSSSAVLAANSEVIEASPVVIVEENITEAEVVTKDGATSESLDGPTEAVLDQKTEVEENKKVLPSSDNTASHHQFSSAVTVPNSEDIGASLMAIDEDTETEPVTKHGADSKSLDCTTEAVLDEKTDIEEKKEVLSSGDNTARGLEKCSSAVLVSNSEVLGASPMAIVKEKITEAEAVTKDGATPVGCSTESVLEEKAEIQEKKIVVPSSDNTASHDKFSSEEPVPNSEVIGASPMEIVQKNITEALAVTKDGATSESLDSPTDAVLDEKSELGEEKVVLPSSDNTSSHYQFSSALPSIVVISEDSRTEDGAVTKACADLVTPDSLNHPKEIVLDKKTVIEEKKEVLPSTDDCAKCVATDEVTGPSPMVISEDKITEKVAVTMECAVLVTHESSNHPGETDLDKKTDIEEKKVVLPSTDDSAKCAATDEVTRPSAVVISEEKSTEDEAVNKDNADVVSPEPKIYPPEAVSEIADIEEVKTEVSPSSDNSANSDHDDADLVMSHGETKASQGGVEPSVVSLNPNGEGVVNVQVDGIDSVVREAHLVDAKVESDDRVDGASRTALVSIHESSSASDRGEAKGNVEGLGTDAELEMHRANENQNFSDDPKQLTASGITVVVDSDISLNVEIQEDKIQNEQPVSTTLGAVIDGQDAVISQDKVVDGEEGSCEKFEEIKSEIPAVDDSAENMQIVEEGVCSEVEKEDLMAVEDHAVAHDAIVSSEECGVPQSTKQETETSKQEVGKVENINSMPNEVASVAPVSDTDQVHVSPERTEKAAHVEEIKRLEKKSSEEDHEPQDCNGFGSLKDHTSETKVDAELVAEGPSETEKSKLSTEEMLKHTSSFRMSQSGYLTPPENEGDFAPSDLVWGKVRSHPWWPGQIFDPDDASEKAVKYHKKDSYLVAYFGDQTFAWNDSSALKPFRPHFTQIEKQSSSEAFHNAVTCALDEVERRVELGLACSCIPKDAYAKIETQVVENTGIREEASLRFGVDRSTQASHFEPDKLLHYITGLAPRASSRADRLDLVIARAQLSAFFRFKGYRSLAEFPLSGALLESDVDTEKVSDKAVTLHKRKHVPKDGSQSKERNLVELMGDREYSTDVEDEFGADDSGKSVGKKRKALDPLAEGSEKRLTVYAAKVSTSATQAPKPSFKIGECIRRVASQLTGSTPLIKDETVIDGSPNVYEHSEKQSAVVSAESLSVSEMLSRIELVALNPKKRHGFHNNFRAFFLGFRSSVAINRRGRKKKSEQTVGGSGEEFEFDDVNDSYWTDRIVQNYSEGQLPHELENGTPNLHLVPFTGEKPVKTGRKPHSRKRFSSSISPTVPTEEEENAKRRKQESSPAELILNFAERNRVPSEINLNKMFRRFGPLMESETEVDHELGCAKVIFKRGSDAEVAQNSAEKFSIFGPVLVNYQIGYSPVISVKILPVALPQPQEDESLMV